MDPPSGRPKPLRALAPTPSYRTSTALLAFAWAAFASSTVVAQRPVQTFDPFYKGETASRTFYDRYAVTGEVSYRPAGLLQGGGVPSTASDPFGVSLRFDYRLTTGLDLSAYVDASGNTAGRNFLLNWVSIKYYRRQEATDYAIRLAVDPASDGLSGFPQTDLAFLYTSTLSPTLRSDFAVGIRRVQLGFQRIVPTEAVINPLDPIVSAAGPDREILRTRAHGWEVHMMMGYQVLFDPAGSNLFVTMIGEGGRYDLVEWTVANALDEDVEERTTTSFKGGVVWVRTGLEFDRPAYQFSPFLGIPIKQWVPSDDGDYPHARAHIGLRLMIR